MHPRPLEHAPRIAAARLLERKPAGLRGQTAEDGPQGVRHAPAHDDLPGCAPHPAAGLQIAAQAFAQRSVGRGGVRTAAFLLQQRVLHIAPPLRPGKARRAAVLPAEIAGRPWCSGRGRRGRRRLRPAGFRGAVDKIPAAPLCLDIALADQLLIGVADRIPAHPQLVRQLADGGKRRALHQRAARDFLPNRRVNLLIQRPCILLRNVDHVHPSAGLCPCKIKGGLHACRIQIAFDRFYYTTASASAPACFLRARGYKGPLR